MDELRTENALLVDTKGEIEEQLFVAMKQSEAVVALEKELAKYKQETNRLLSVSVVCTHSQVFCPAYLYIQLYRVLFSTIDPGAYKK